MANNQANVRIRFTQAHTALETLRKAERSPQLDPGQREFETGLISFIALAQSCVSMAELSRQDINTVVNAWPDQDDRDLFNWFRAARNDSLKGGNSILKSRVDYIDEYDYKMRFRLNTAQSPQWHAAFTFTGATRTQRPKYGVNVFELEINGACHGATQVCGRYLNLLQRFLQDPAVFGPSF